MILYIDTHFSSIVIILFKDGKIINKKIINDVKQHSTILMPTIIEVLDKRIPDSIVVVNGPGSFTAVRLGVVVAKTLAYTLNIPIRAITSLECLAVSIEESEKTVAFSDNNGYYVGKFDCNNELIDEYKYYSNNDFETFKKTERVLIDVNEDYEKIINFALQRPMINPHKVNPIYVKKLNIEK